MKLNPINRIDGDGWPLAVIGLLPVAKDNRLVKMFSLLIVYTVLSSTTCVSSVVGDSDEQEVFTNKSDNNLKFLFQMKTSPW